MTKLFSNIIDPHHWPQFYRWLIGPCSFSHAWSAVKATAYMYVRQPCHERALKVIKGHLYWCQQKPRTDSVILHNNVDIISETKCWPTTAYHHYDIVTFISKVSEKVATQIANSCRRRQPHSYLTLPPRGTPANVRTQLIFPEIRVIGLHFCCW